MSLKAQTHDVIDESFEAKEMLTRSETVLQNLEHINRIFEAISGF